MKAVKPVKQPSPRRATGNPDRFCRSLLFNGAEYRDAYGNTYRRDLRIGGLVKTNFFNPTQPRGTR